jgi:hyperosmotically inducible protein
MASVVLIDVHSKGDVMKHTALAAAGLAAFLALPVAGHSEDRDRDHAAPKAFVKDSVITTKIKTELAANKLASLVHIKVDTDDNGAVLLSGYARTQEEVDRAGRIARDVKGVKSVDNQIRVRPNL